MGGSLAEPPSPPSSPVDRCQPLTRVVEALPCAVAAVERGGFICAANAAWRLAFQSDGTGGATGRLGDLFRDAAGAATETLRDGRMVLQAVPLACGPSGSAAWWDLELIAHPELADVVLVNAREVTDLVLARRERDEAREALEPVDARLRLTQEAAGIGTWEWDAAADRQSWSPQQFRLHGLDPASAMPPSFEEWCAMVHPEDRPHILAARERGFRGSSGSSDFQAEFRIRRADTGAERWLLALGRVMERAPEGRMRRVLGVNVDITERRDEQEALRESEALLRLASEAAGVYAWDWDIASGRVHWAEGLERALDLPEGGFGGSVDAFRALVHPDDVAKVEAATRRALDGDAAGYRATFRMIRADGSVRWTETRGVVLRDAAGGPVRLVGVDHDISEQKGVEVSLGEGEARFRALVDAVPQMIHVTSADGAGVYANRRWLEYSGQTAGQAERGGWMAVLHPDDRDATMAGWADAVARGGRFEREHRLRGRDGQYRWFLSRAVAWREPGDERTDRWLGTSTDISAIVRARELAESLSARLAVQVADRTRSLTEAAVELQAEMRRRQDAQSALMQSRKLEALGQLTAGVAHDFNNVLTAIKGSFELIERRLTDPNLLQIVGMGKSAADRAVALTRQLLDFGRSEALVRSALEIETAIHRANELIGHAAGSGVGREVDIAPGVWPVLTDGHQLEVALLNLAVNARDAMPDGGRLVLAARNLTPRERPAVLPPRDYVCISVQDSGQGMPRDVLARAVEPFFTTKPEGQGTGLGLPMVNAFALRSGGCLQIESREGVGTTVKIVLPRASVTGLEEGEEAYFDGPGEATTILFVEDDEQVRQITAKYLRDRGFCVIEASNAEAAVVLSHSVEQLDLLLTDIVMPGADGVVLAQRLRVAYPDVPALFISGFGGRADLAGEQVVPKPFTGPDLVRAINRRLNRMSGADLGDGGLLHRLRNPALVAAYVFWRTARHGDKPPRLADLDWGGLPDRENAFTVAVEPAGDAVRFRFVRVGSALTSRLGRPLAGTDVVAQQEPDPNDEVLGSLTAAYRRCARTLAPSYEYAKYDFGEGSPVLFERLILPVSDDGERVTHLVGLALFSGDL